MPPAQAGTALAERAGEAGHHERDRGARGICTDRRHRDHGWKDTRPSPSLGTAHLSASKTGLVLVGGGARGAYQAGGLQGLAEIVGERFGDRPPFDVVTGISAGAINAAYLASRADRMAEAPDELIGRQSSEGSIPLLVIRPSVGVRRRARRPLAGVTPRVGGAG